MKNLIVRGIAIPETYSTERKRTARLNTKLEVLTHYSHRGILGCCWEGCSVYDLDMLTLDHINDDGAKHILPGASERLTSYGLYRWAKSNGYPKEFQTLCANHQLKKQILKAH
jgi:hypothetical protein